MIPDSEHAFSGCASPGSPAFRAYLAKLPADQRQRLRALVEARGARGIGKLADAFKAAACHLARRIPGGLSC